MITISEIRPNRHLLSIDGEPQMILNDRELEEFCEARNRGTVLDDLKSHWDGLKSEIRALRTDA